MIADLISVQVFQPETEQEVSTLTIKRNLLINVWLKIKQFYKWINPKNWFNRFSKMEIDMSEFL